jgi:hypothetical protein
MNLTLIVAAASGVFAFFVGFGAAWQMQGANITEMELAHAQQRIETARVNRVTAERVAGQLAQAQAHATAGAIQLRAELSTAVNAGNGLRIATGSAVRAAATDPAICSDTAATLGELFDDSSKAYGELAEKAQRHTIDIEALMTRQR